MDWIFHQTEKSLSLAQKVGLTQGSVSGDTRFDRVKQIKNRDNSVELISEFKAEKKLLVFGSSWEAEEKMAQILSRKLENFKILIAPHDLKRVQNLKQIFPSAILYSELKYNYHIVFSRSLLLSTPCLPCLVYIRVRHSIATLPIVS